MSRAALLLLALTALVVGGEPAAGPTRVSLAVLTDRVLELTLQDGWTAYPTHALTGRDLHRPPALDIAAWSDPASYRVLAVDDAGWPAAAPLRVGRKTRPREAALHQHPQPFGIVLEHHLYLELPRALRAGATYEVRHASGLRTLVTWDPERSESAAIHVNQVGYLPDAPKYAYLSAWLGDLGGLAIDERLGTVFRLLEAESRREVFRGQVRLRKRASEPDSLHADDGPRGTGNHLACDLAECDFSAFTGSGRFVLAIEGVGCSLPFRIDRAVYRTAYRGTARGLYHQRCGTAKTAPYTDWTHPRCHHPDDGTLFQQTNHRQLDKAWSDGWPEAARHTTGEQRAIWGGWHDAGDWDREAGHVNIVFPLLLVYELAPQAFPDGELRIPESGNGLPDILDHARWGVDYYRRLQRPNGAVSVGVHANTYPIVPWASWQDPMQWFVYAEDPRASYDHAASSAHLAHCLRLAGRGPLAEEYLRSALAAWDWAEAHQRADDGPKVRDARQHAAAQLFRATGEARFHQAFREALLIRAPEVPLMVWAQHDQQRAVWTYCLTERPEVDRELQQMLRQAALTWARRIGVETAQRRGLRMAYDWGRPLFWSAATRMQTLPLIVAHALSGDRAFLDPQITTADAILGANPLNLCWVVGLGSRWPEQIFHLDSWHLGVPMPGFVPEGPHRYDGDGGGSPFEFKWVYGFCYPHAREWPSLELYFESRYCPPTNETETVIILENAAAFAYLAAVAERGR
ncbi:MAG: glycoside hydrolase family 9 protein [Planctomycetota bacterium]|nr:glycoside hydrolase family 9 protein [Planctomycetota bacterium]MDW8373704.1 glycoside hydrolase family 9 protein [Planctomycetota bacterium]